MSGFRDRTKRRGAVGVKSAIPNALTLLGMGAGVTAIHFTLSDNWSKALLALTFAAVLDMLDGRAARWLKAESNFGAQLDSLADLVSFGVAPAVIVSAWAFRQTREGWLFALLFCACAAVRLARFNCERDSRAAGAPAPYFAGVPTPGAAGLILLPLLLQLQSKWPGFQEPMLNMAVVALVSLLMVARLPTPSLKRLPFLTAKRPLLAVAAVVSIALALRWPWATASAGWLAYAVSLPISLLAWRVGRGRASP